MKKHNAKIIFNFLFAVFIFSFLVFNLALAGADVNLNLTPPGIEKGQTPEFGAYLQWLLKFLFGAVGILTVLMIIIGGLQYVIAGASGNPENVKNAKSRIMMAIGGLLLALSSWLILSVINPDLLKLKLPSLSKISVAPTKPIIEEIKGADICFKCYNEKNELIGCNKNEVVSCDIRKEVTKSCAACDNSEIAPGELAETCRTIYDLPLAQNIKLRRWEGLCQESSKFQCFINYKLPDGTPATASAGALEPGAIEIFEINNECQIQCQKYADNLNKKLKSDKTPPEAKGGCVPTEKEKKNIGSFN